MFIIICIGFGVLSVVSYQSTHSINISFVNSVIWTFLSVMVVIMGLPKSLQSFLFVFFNTLVFTICYLLLLSSSRVSIKNINENNTDSPINLELFNKINKVVAFLGIAGLIYLAFSLGFRLSTFTSINSLMVKMNAISHMRYSEDGDYLPVVNRLINTMSYAACGYAGFSSVIKQKKEYVYNLIILALQTVLTNTKATIVFAIAFYLGGLLTGYSFFKKRLRAKSLIAAALLLIVIICFATFIDYFRHAGQIDLLTEYKKIMSSYFVGPYSAFSIWFENSPKDSFDLGSNTFSSVFRILGITPQVHGEFVNINGTQTNVYTVFKHLINDYSMPGTIIVSALMGYISAITDVYISCRKKNAIGFSIVIIATISICFFSSIFRYTINVLACIIIILYGLIQSKKKEN